MKDISTMNMTELLQAEKEMEKYWAEIKERDHLSYSYPFHQKKAIEDRRKILLKGSGVNGNEI